MLKPNIFSDLGRQLILILWNHKNSILRNYKNINRNNKNNIVLEISDNRKKLFFRRFHHDILKDFVVKSKLSR